MNCRSAVSVCPLSSRSSQLRLVNDKRDLDRYTTQSVLLSTLTLQTADCQPAHRDRHSKGLTSCGPATAPSTSPGLSFRSSEARRRGTPHPMGPRNDDTIEDTRARKYSKIPTTPNPPKDQKNPADWRSLLRKSLSTSRILATQEHNTTAPKKLLCRIESCDRLRLRSEL